jgi:pimeloyl-ACP methyl ester carboxylesterase
MTDPDYILRVSDLDNPTSEISEALSEHADAAVPEAIGQQVEAAQSAASAAQASADAAESAAVTATTSAATTQRLDSLANGDQARSLGLSLVAFADADSFLEAWADLTQWTSSGPVAVSDGYFYSTAVDGTDGQVDRAVAIGTSDFIVTAKLNVSSSGGGDGADFAMIRVGMGDSWSSATSIGIGGNGNGELVGYIGTSVGGTGTITLGSSLGGGIWTVTIYGDSQYISITATSPDGATTYKARSARSNFSSGITRIRVSNDDRRGLTGTRQGELSIRHATVAATTPTLRSASIEAYTATNSEDTRIVLPAQFDSRRPAPVIISCHGNTQTQDHMTLSTQRKTLVKYFTDAGFIYAASHMSGNQWGAQAAITDLVELWKYLRDHFPVGPLVILGESMGGLATMNAVHRAALPIAGVGIVDGVMNLGWQYANGISGAGVPDSDGIDAAYGISGDYAAKTAGYDPALADPRSYRGVPIKFGASPDDLRVPKANHADVLYSRISSIYPDTTSLDVTSGGHTVDSHFFTSAWGAYFKGCVATT